MANNAERSVWPAQTVKLECLPDFGEFRGERCQRCVMEVLAGRQELIGLPFKKCPHSELVAEAGAELDSVDQIIVGGVAEFVQPAGN